ncbi:hypothetical protein SCANM63S_09942 [Streptomyces canarius]
METEPLEAPLDLHNMSTLMLEKEDLGYRWSFETHADWLEPLQEKVEGSPDRSAACAVVPGKGTADGPLAQVSCGPGRSWRTTWRTRSPRRPAGRGPWWST